MSKRVDQRYLRTEQYRDSANLTARIELHRLFSTNPYPWQRWVFDQFDFPSGTRVVELGCGPGNLWRDNADRLPQDFHLTLADLSRGMLKEARERVAPFLECDYLTLDAGFMPLENARFDAVIANHMLYHLPDIDHGLRDIARILKSGGRLFAATNGLHHMQELHQLAKRIILDQNQGWRPILGFRLENAEEILNSYFKPIDIKIYPSELEVTQWEPLEAYIRSMISLPQGQVAKTIQATREYVHSVIAERGSFHITKAQGLVIGVRV
jgi:ubiquinone/menaquinone biosynthesis C-methylase UbiE